MCIDFLPFFLPFFSFFFLGVSQLLSHYNMKEFQAPFCFKRNLVINGDFLLFCAWWSHFNTPSTWFLKIFFFSFGVLQKGWPNMFLYLLVLGKFKIWSHFFSCWVHINILLAFLGSVLMILLVFCTFLVQLMYVYYPIKITQHACVVYTLIIKFHVSFC